MDGHVWIAFSRMAVMFHGLFAMVILETRRTILSGVRAAGTSFIMKGEVSAPSLSCYLLVLTPFSEH